MTDIKAMVASLAPRMNLQLGTPGGERKSKGFVVDVPLKEESSVAFISKKPMGKPITSGSISSVEIFSDRIFTPAKASPKVEVFATGTIAPKVEEVEELVPQPIKVTSKPVQTIGIDPECPIPNVTNLLKSISKVSNLIKDWLHCGDTFNIVKSNIKDKKMYPETFYSKIQNCIYHSLREFCGITKDDRGNDIIPVVVYDTKSYPTLTFFDRMFNDKTVSYEKDPTKVMEKYRNTFKDATGIQPAWVEHFNARVKSKMPMIDEAGIKQITDFIMMEWGYRPRGASEAMMMYSDQADFENADEVEDISAAGVEKVETLQDLMDKYEQDNCDCHNHDDEEVVEEADDENDNFMRVSIIREEDIDVVKIESSDGYGRVAVPFYTNLGELNMDQKLVSIVDDRNGIWDWLIHFAPDFMFNTKYPERYLDANYDDLSDMNLKFVIMDEHEGTYVVGVYFISRITLFDGDKPGEDDFTNETVALINKLVNDEVATGFMSHLSRSLSNPSLFRDEEYILNHIMSGEECDDEDDEDVVVETPEEEPIDEGVSEVAATIDEEDSASRAAIEAMIGATNDISEEDHQMDNSVVTVGGKQFDDEEDFTFVPIQKKQRLQD